jgi:hypothetical protein
MMTELVCELAWNPLKVNLEVFARLWTTRRYGPDQAAQLQPVTDILVQTLYSYYNWGLTNHSLFRDWSGGYLPGLVPSSAKRTIGYLPLLREALETMLKAPQWMEDDALYHFDLVDIGRTYLAAVFNHELAGARNAFRARDIQSFEEHAEKTIETMDFLAKYVSANKEFRLQTQDTWAEGWPEFLLGQSNREANWCTLTCVTGKENFDLLDYMAEDYAELITHYFKPRVQLYIEKMRELLSKGDDISGRLVYRDTDTDIPYRVSEWATPQVNLPWSPYGAPCEPELTAEDSSLVREIINAGTVSGKFDYYVGSLQQLTRELLDRYPVPENLADILHEPSPEIQADQRQFLAGSPGSTIRGFKAPGIVERVDVSGELSAFLNVEKLSSEYNIARGDIASYRVMVSDWLTLTRLADQKASFGDQRVAVFTFEVLGRKWILRYDPGSDVASAVLSIHPEQDAAK